MSFIGNNKAPYETNKTALPKNWKIKPDDEPLHIKVIEHYESGKSEVNQSEFDSDLEPSRPFIDMLDVIFKDPRLELSLDTYVQMILGSGMKVKAKKKKTEDKIRDWWDMIQFEEQIENALYSYVGVGNMIFEKAPNNADFVEVDIATVKSITRNKRGKIGRYIQDVNNTKIELKPKEIIHLKFSNVRREVWGRGIFNAILNKYTDPDSGKTYAAPIMLMKKMEEDMGLIFTSYASPMMMFHFEDAGENFIKNQADALKDAKAGAKIVTDKAFKWEVLETNPNAKYDKYVEHLQKDVIEPGSQFPLQFFNAGFTARAASESTDSVLIRKVKRIQKRLGTQIRTHFVMPYLRSIGIKDKEEDIDIVFEFESKTEVTTVDLITMFRDNILRRSEVRKAIVKTTTIDIDQNDMADEPPITSVTPTNKMGDGEEEPKALPNRLNLKTKEGKKKHA